MAHVSGEKTQPGEYVADSTFEMFKRSRMEMAGTGETILVRPCSDTSKGFTVAPAARTQPLHHEHGTPFCQGGGSNQPREINVPNEMASAGGCAAAGGGAPGGRFDYGLKMRDDNNGDLSVYWTEDLMQVLEDRNFTITVGSGELGVKVHLTCHAIRDCVTY